MNSGSRGVKDPTTAPPDAPGLADYLVGLGGAYASSPGILLARVLSDLGPTGIVDPLAAHGLLDPATIFDAFTTVRAAGLRPFLDPLFAVVAYPRQFLTQLPQQGDVMLRRALGEPGLGHAAFVAAPEAYTRESAMSRGLRLESYRPGFYLHVVEGGVIPHRLAHRYARRIASPEGQVGHDTLLLRPRVLSERSGAIRLPARSWHGGRGVAEADGSAPNIDVAQAVQANRQYGAQLGWVSRFDDIVTLLGLNASPTEEAFAQAVAVWQSQHGLAVDGMLGPNTWSAMQPFLGSGPPAPPQPPQPSIDVNSAVQANRQYAIQLGWGLQVLQIDSLLGLTATSSEQDFAQAVAIWQGQQGLSVDGIIGPQTWAAMQPLLAGPSPVPPSPLPVPPLPTPPPVPIPPFPFPSTITQATLNDLTDFVRPVSMGLTSDPSKKLAQPSAPTFTLSLSDAQGWSATLTVDGNGVVASGVQFPAQMGKFTVFSNLIWSSLSLNDPGVTLGTDIQLPLNAGFLLALAQAGSSRTRIAAGKVSTFPLATEIQTYATLVFGYSVNSQTGTVTPLDLSAVEPGQLTTWLGNHGFSAPTNTSNTVVIATYDLSFTSPNDDFQPKGAAPMGAANVVRTYPLLSVWSSRGITAVNAELDIARPAASPMPGMARGGTISGALYTDMNSGIRSLWQDLDPVVQTAISALASTNTLAMPFPGPVVAPSAVVAAFNAIPSVRWDSLFAHYSLDAARSSITVVSPRFPRRADTTSRQVFDKSKSTYSTGPAVTKVERQGMFDNLHVAPAMDYKGAPAFMAPLCQHDCLHIHWRWGASFTDIPVKGWSGGLPYKKPGAPMIPENQTLKISVSGATMSYIPTAENAPAQAWQIFMHHGTGYVSGLTPVGALAPMLELGQLTSVLPDFATFYYHNRMWEFSGPSSGTDKTRLNEAGFAPLEAL